MGRINGNLNVSRSLGDLKYKQVEQIPPEEQVREASQGIEIGERRRNAEILKCMDEKMGGWMDGDHVVK